MSSNIERIAILIAVAAGAVGAPARADTTRRHGALCAPKYTSRDLVGVDERGMSNESTTLSARITCPIPERVTQSISFHEDTSTTAGTTSVKVVGTGTRIPNIREVIVYGRDLSATSPFWCYLFWTEPEGFSSWGPRRYMCSDDGGCTDSTTEFTGIAKIRWSVAAHTNTNTAMAGVVCDVPAKVSGEPSYVKAVESQDAGVVVLTYLHRLALTLFSRTW